MSNDRSVSFSRLDAHSESYVLFFGQYGPVTIHQTFGVRGLLIAAPLGALCIWLAAKIPVEGGM